MSSTSTVATVRSTLSSAQSALSSTTARATSTQTTHAAITTTSSIPASTSTVASSVSTTTTSTFPPISSGSTTGTTTTNSSDKPSLVSPVASDINPGGTSKSTIIAISVIFSLLGCGLLLCLVYFLFSRCRRDRRKQQETQGAPKRAFGSHPGSLDSHLQATLRPYDHPGALESWINARVEEGGNGGSGSGTLVVPKDSGPPESVVHKPWSPPTSSVQRVPRKPLPPSGFPRSCSDGQSTRSSAASPQRESSRDAGHVEAIPIPNRSSQVQSSQGSSDQDRIRATPRYERTSSELFQPGLTYVHAPGESSPTPSSMCIHDVSEHSHEEPRGVKIGNVSTKLPLLCFPQDHEGHISARASIHSGNTHVAHVHNTPTTQRARTSSLPMAHLRKARSVENVGAARKPLARPSRKEVPKYVLDEFGKLVNAPRAGSNSGPQTSSQSINLERPRLHSKSRSVSMAPSVPVR